MVASSALAQVLRHPGVWRRAAGEERAVAACASGWSALDAVLPGGGWPLGALSEILVEHDGLGELALVLPALIGLARAERRIVCIAPPYLPYPPALAEAGLDLTRLSLIQAAPADVLWTLEQCLRSGCCDAVLGWLPQVQYQQLRRLQLAAESGGALGFIFRPARVLAQPSPAALRLQVIHDGAASRVDILKCRGRFDAQRSLRFRLRA